MNKFGLMVVEFLKAEDGPTAGPDKSGLLPAPSLLSRLENSIDTPVS